MTLIARLKRAARAAAGRGDGAVEARLKEISDRLTRVEESIADLKPNIKMLPAIIRKLYLDGEELPSPYDLLSQRFRYLSQNEEDGLLLALFKRIGTTTRRCVEIGCGMNGGNSGFFVRECGWSGLMVDANRKSIAAVRRRFTGHDVIAEKHRVSRENIDIVLSQHGFAGDLDLLSIDVDGMDYWIWDALTASSARVVAVEYNWLFGPERAVTIPYDASFRLSAAGTRGYRGASLAALVCLARRKGYRLVATERVNAFFLRSDVEPSIAEIDVRRGYRAPPKASAAVGDVFTKIEQAGLPLVTISEG